MATYDADTYFLTTPIYYVTARPHLGHAYTTIVGDALARWHRLLGEDVYYLTGTDEHGQKVQDAADAAGLSPQAFADSIAPLYQEAWAALDISNDDFIRTTEERHKVGVAELLQRCYDAGDIELDVYKGKYCVACEEYYTDDELIDGELCPIHKIEVQYYEEENYFFRLSRFQDRLLDWYAAHPKAIVPEFRGNEALGLIKGGLRDFSVSRTSLKWGIPLPWDPGHVAYVWFDALANYLTAVGFGTDPEEFDRWWPARHLIGKDIIRHHCVYWPAMLLSAGIEPPLQWAVGGWLLSGGEKMSKTSGNVVNPLDLTSTSSASTGSATTCSPRRRTATTATSPTRASPLGTTAIWPTTSATCRRASPRWSGASATASVRRRPPTRHSGRSPHPQSRRPAPRGRRSSRAAPWRRRGR